MDQIKRKWRIYISAKSKVNWEEQLPKIKELGLSGWRMPQIAEYYGVSRQRVKQVLLTYIPEWHSHYGGVVLKEQTKAAFFDKWGKKEATDLYKEQRHKFSRKKANAIKVGYTWTVTFGELEWPTYCPILGLELDYFAETRLENSPSFDRIDSNIGYEKGNVIIISWRANRIKNDGTEEEHRKIADFIKAHQP